MGLRLSRVRPPPPALRRCIFGASADDLGAVRLALASRPESSGWSCACLRSSASRILALMSSLPLAVGHRCSSGCGSGRPAPPCHAAGHGVEGVYSQVVGIPWPAESPRMRRSPRRPRSSTTRKSCGRRASRRVGSRNRCANGASAWPLARAPRPARRRRACSSAERYCHITLCHSTVVVPAASSRPCTNDTASWRRTSSGRSLATRARRAAARAGAAGRATRRPSACSRPSVVPRPPASRRCRAARRSPGPATAGAARPARPVETYGGAASPYACPPRRRRRTGPRAGSARRDEPISNSRTGSGDARRAWSSPPISAPARPTSLVCGGRSSHSRTASGCSASSARERGPAALGLPGAADAGVVRRQLARAALEHQPVHGAEQPQPQRRGPGVVLVAAQHLGGDAARLEVVGQPVSRSAYIGEPRSAHASRLPPERLDESRPPAFSAACSPPAGGGR